MSNKKTLCTTSATNENRFFSGSLTNTKKAEATQPFGLSFKEKMFQVTPDNNRHLASYTTALTTTQTPRGPDNDADVDYDP